MNKTVVAWVAMNLCVVGLGEVSLARAELWINPLFESCPAAGRGGNGSFVRLADGSLMVVEASATRTSQDDGETWSDPSPIVYEGQEPGIPSKGPMLRTPDGVLVMVYQDLGSYHWEWDDSQGEAVHPRFDVWAIRSLDDGRTWVDRQMIFQGYCGALEDIIQTESGHIVVPVQQYLPDPARHGTATYVSADQGKSWRRSNLIDMGGVGAHDGVFEATLVELKDGRLYMLMRTSWERFWEAYSWDKGLSWRQVGPSNIPTGSSSGCITRLASGRVALVWTSPLPGGKPRSLAEVLSTPPPAKATEYFYIVPNPSLGARQVSITFSEDETQTWTNPIVIGRESLENAGLRYVYLYEPEPGLLWIHSGGSHSGLDVSAREADLVEHLRKEEGKPGRDQPLR